jgi:predicted transposase YdaD
MEKHCNIYVLLSCICSCKDRQASRKEGRKEGRQEGRQAGRQAGRVDLKKPSWVKCRTTKGLTLSQLYTTLQSNRFSFIQVHAKYA